MKTCYLPQLVPVSLVVHLNSVLAFYGSAFMALHVYGMEWNVDVSVLGCDLGIYV